MGRDGHVRIADYGLSRLTKKPTTDDLANTSRVASTNYLAPEVMEIDARPTYESDVWSFGCVCLLLSGYVFR